MARASSNYMAYVHHAEGFAEKQTSEAFVRPRNAPMDAFVRHIHGNERFAIENVARAVEAIRGKKKDEG